MQPSRSPWLQTSSPTASPPAASRRYRYSAGRKEGARGMNAYVIRPCCAETVFPAPTEINLVTINRDRRTQRRQPEAKSQSDEVERDGGGKGGLLGEKPAETIKIKRGGGGGRRQGEPGRVGGGPEGEILSQLLFWGDSTDLHSPWTVNERYPSAGCLYEAVQRQHYADCFISVIWINKPAGGWGVWGGSGGGRNL